MWREGLTVYLVRHGETELNVSDCLRGRADVALNATGRSQAEALGRAFSGVRARRVLSSPLQRALNTCRLAGLGDEAQVLDDLVEWDYGDYEGRTSEEVHRTDPDWLVFKDGCPNGESPAEVGQRIDRVIEQVRGAGGDVAVFAHGHVLRVFVARWLGLDAAEGRFFDLDTATYNMLGYYHASPAVLRWNAPLAMGG